MKRALITGITGQDGSYLAEFLLAKGYEVHGLVRRARTFNTSRIDHIRDQLQLHYGDLVDSTSLHTVIRGVEPHEIYNLAAQSHVRVSFDMPEYTCDVTAAGVAVRRSRSTGPLPNPAAIAGGRLYFLATTMVLTVACTPSTTSTTTM